MFDDYVFSGGLKGTYTFMWSNRLTAAAGQCRTSIKDGNRRGVIKLSSKLCTSFSRVLDTLAHEIAHLAAWVFEGYSKGHGNTWKCYAFKLLKHFPELGVITRLNQSKQV